jgi:hypothetical protein
MESYRGVESVLRSIAFASFQIPVYITTVSHLRLAADSQAVSVAEEFGIAAIIGGLTRAVRITVGNKRRF